MGSPCSKAPKKKNESKKPTEGNTGQEKNKNIETRNFQGGAGQKPDIIGPDTKVLTDEITVHQPGQDEAEATTPSAEHGRESINEFMFPGDLQNIRHIDSELTVYDGHQGEKKNSEDLLYTIETEDPSELKTVTTFKPPSSFSKAAMLKTDDLSPILETRESVGNEENVFFKSNTRESESFEVLKTASPVLRTNEFNTSEYNTSISVREHNEEKVSYQTTHSLKETTAFVHQNNHDMEDLVEQYLRSTREQFDLDQSTLSYNEDKREINDLNDCKTEPQSSQENPATCLGTATEEKLQKKSIANGLEDEVFLPTDGASNLLTVNMSDKIIEEKSLELKTQVTSTQGKSFETFCEETWSKEYIRTQSENLKTQFDVQIFDDEKQDTQDSLNPSGKSGTVGSRNSEEEEDEILKTELVPNHSEPTTQQIITKNDKSDDLLRTVLPPITASRDDDK